MNKLYNNVLISRFIILQPILDIFTSIMINEFHMSISLGMIIRFIFLLYEVIYLIKLKDKKCLTFLVLFGLYGLISLIGNYILKDTFNILSHLSFLLKMIYFPITLLFFYEYFKNNSLIFKKTFSIIAIIIGVSLIISLLTNTYYCSYITEGNCIKGGVVGWFNSANQLGVILSCLLGLLLSNHMEKGRITSYIPLLIVVIFLSVIGTKTAILAIIGIIFTYILYYFLSLIKDKGKKILLKRVLSVIPILIALLLLIKVLPIHYNITESIKYASGDLIDIKEQELKKDNNEEGKKEIKEEVKEEKTEIKTEEKTVPEELNKDEIIYNQVVFQGRNDYIVANKEIFDNSDFFHKLFGITNYGNFYEDKSPARINERDFHDAYMLYGIVGLILILLLPIILIIKLIINIKNNIKIFLNDEFIILGITVSLILGISYMAGHVLFQPSVSIYFVYLIVSLLNVSEVKS